MFREFKITVQFDSLTKEKIYIVEETDIILRTHIHYFYDYKLFHKFIKNSVLKYLREYNGLSKIGE